MEYRLEDILSVRNYQETCNIFFELAPSEEIKNILKEILYTGKYKDFLFTSHLSNKNNPINECQRRLSMAMTLISNPETFEYIINNQINIFHGTNSNAIFSILEYGLISAATFKEKTGNEVTTGEKSTQRKNKPRTFISMTDILEIAEGYSTINPSNKSFGIIIGTDKSSIKKSRIINIHSDVPEIGLAADLPLESIKVIFCQTSEINFVKKIVGDKSIKVLALDNLDKSFYAVDEYSDGIVIYKEKIASLKNNEPKENKKFKEEEVEKLLKQRRFSNIKEYLEKIKELFNKEQSHEHRNR